MADTSVPSVPRSVSLQNPGHEAIFKTGENLATQVASFFIFGLGVGFAIGGILLIIVLPVLLHYAVPVFIVKLTALALMSSSLLWTLIGGAYWIDPASNAVPKIGGSYISFWLLPAGLSWWLPRPLGSRSVSIHVGEVTVTLTENEIEAADNVHMSARYTIVFRVLYPLIFARYDGKAGEAFRGLMNRTLRWFVSHHASTKLPATRDSASLIMSGAKDKIMVDVPGEKTKGGNQKRKTLWFWLDKKDENTSVARLANGISFDVISVYLEDFTLPKDIVDAQAEIQQAHARGAALEVIAEMVNSLRNQYKNLNIYALLENIYADAEIADLVVLRGKGGDFERGNAISSSTDRRAARTGRKRAKKAA